MSATASTSQEQVEPTGRCTGHSSRRCRGCPRCAPSVSTRSRHLLPLIQHGLQIRRHGAALQRMMRKLVAIAPETAVTTTLLGAPTLARDALVCLLKARAQDGRILQ